MVWAMVGAAARAGASEEAPPLEAPPVEESAPAAAPEPAWTPATPEDLLHLARERLRHGDWDGVHLLATQAVDMPGDHQRQAQYLDAMAYEFGGEPEEALAIYDALLAVADPRGEGTDDVRFRRAECLGGLGRYAEAHAELARLPEVDRPPLDVLKIDVLTGTWELALGKERKGYRRLARALDHAEPGQGTYYQAVARDAILDRALQGAELLTFEGSDRAKRKALEQRAALMEVASTQLAEIIRLDEPSFALEGFERLGDAYVSLGHALLAESPLVKLTEAQRVINRQLLEERVSGVWVKAALLYDRGITYGAQADWTSEPVPTLIDDKLAAERLVEELAAKAAP